MTNTIMFALHMENLSCPPIERQKVSEDMHFPNLSAHQLVRLNLIAVGASYSYKNIP